MFADGTTRSGESTIDYPKGVALMQWLSYTRLRSDPVSHGLSMAVMHSTRRFVLFAAIAILTTKAGPVAVVSAAEHEGWGTLQGQILFSGAYPEPELLEITRDEEVCGGLGLVDESLVINRMNGGLIGVIVWLESRQPVPIHPNLAGSPEKPPRMDNKNCVFTPRVLAARVGQPMEFSNSDSVAHNAAVYARRNQPFSQVVPQSSPLVQVFLKAENQPVRVDCSIHAWMKGWIMVTDHPYAAVTDADGRFRISDLPAGEWSFRFWHERSGNLSSLTLSTTELKLTKGSTNLVIEAGKVNDLGTIQALGSQFLVD